MKKKTGIMAAVVLALLSIAAFWLCGQTRVRIGKSKQYSQNELENAISCVQKENVEFKKIWYDEKESNRILEEFEESDGDSENLIAIGSNFKSDNILYENHIWILKRKNISDNWRIVASYNSERQ